MLEIAQKDNVPECPESRGILKPDVVFFGEALPVKALEQAEKESSMCDLFIVVGSTLTVYPAALMPEIAVSGGAKLLIINLSPTPLDKAAELVINCKAGKILPEIVSRIKAYPGTV